VEGLGRDTAAAWLAGTTGEPDEEGPGAAGGIGARGVAVAGPAARAAAAAAAVAGVPEVDAGASLWGVVAAPATAGEESGD
jgi:hypothetical protein